MCRNSCVKWIGMDKNMTWPTGRAFIDSFPQFTPYTYCLPPTSSATRSNDVSLSLWCRKAGCDTCDGKLYVKNLQDREIILTPDMAGTYEINTGRWYHGMSADEFLKNNPDAEFHTMCCPPQTSNGDGSCLMYCKKQDCAYCQGNHGALNLGARFVRFTMDA